MDRTSLFWSVGIEACVSILSWVLVGWIVRQWLGRFISDWICGGWLVLCVKYRIWDVKPRTPEQLPQTRGIFWKIVPFPTMINRYNFWVGFITENLCALSAVFLAHLAWNFLISPQHAVVIGHAITITMFFDRPFELNPPPLPPVTTNSLGGIMWKLMGTRLQMSAHKLLAYASTPAKRHRRSQCTTKELVPFPDVFPVELLREIVDATLHQIWEVTDKMRDPEFSDVLSLMLTCKAFKSWASPQFYQYVHIANPTRVRQLARCLVRAINNGNPSRRFQEWEIRGGNKLVDEYMERAPRICALSLVDYTWTLNQHLNEFTMLVRVLPHLRRLNVHWSLLHELRQRRIAFPAAQITIVMDAPPPTNIAEIAARDMQPFPVEENIGIRFSYPLDAGGKVPPAHRRVCSFIDPTFAYANQGATKKIAMELYIDDEVSTKVTKRAISALPVFLRLGNTFASVGKFTRIVHIVWVGDEEYESWVAPQADGELMDFEGAQETFDKAKKVGPGNTDGIVSFVPLRKRELSQWSFSVLERNGLDFWEEIEKRITERAKETEFRI